MGEIKIKENSQADFEEFVKRLKLLNDKHPDLLKNTLSNIFSMRFIGNKTHGDLAEIALTEFVQQYMYDYSCIHVGKEYYRSKEHEEDIVIRNLIQNIEEYVPVSIKAYGIGPLQLSTDKESTLFDGLKNLKVKDTRDKQVITQVMGLPGFQKLTNVLPLIYEEKKPTKNRAGIYRCNIVLFKKELIKETERIVFVDKGHYYDYTTKKVLKQKKGTKRTHPIYLFLDSNNKYICEVRFGGKGNANALQRSLWTNTKKADKKYFNLFYTQQWLSYNKQEKLIDLIAHSLITTSEAHEDADACLIKYIDQYKPKKYDE